MAYSQRIETAIFDMDGLLIDSEPLWLQAELDVFGALGLDLSDRHKLPDTLGLRIDLVVKMWYQAMPWQGVSLDEVSARIIERAIELVHETRLVAAGRPAGVGTVPRAGAEHRSRLRLAAAYATAGAEDVRS